MTPAQPNNVVLIGYRGCGKTTVGKLLAEELSIPFVDTDGLIAAAAGRSIAEIFACEGETGFRRRESAVLVAVAAKGPAVIGVGGGAVLDDDAMTALKKRGRVIWLTCSCEVLHARIQGDPSSSSSRPALTPADGLSEVRSILAAREPLYRRWSDHTVSSEDRSPLEIAADIARRLS